MVMTALAPPGSISAREPLLWGFALDGHPITEEALKGVESATGLHPDIIVFFVQWPSSGEASSGEFPLESLEAIHRSGALPCITWEPMYIQDSKETTISHVQLLGGRYDTYITRFAEKARVWNKPLLIRFAHEMNLKRYHWGTTEEEYGPGSPALYRQMYRRVVDLFRRSGANNVLWVFCPNAEAVPNTSYDPSALWNTLSNYYPGDSYVDVLGVDGYNWGTTRKRQEHGWDSRWKSFREIFEPPSSELRRLSSSRAGKPLIVFETATVDRGGSKTEWIGDALNASAGLGIDGIVWFQSDKEVDWRIESGSDRGCLSVIKRRMSPAPDWAGTLLNRKVR